MMRRRQRQTSFQDEQQAMPGRARPGLDELRRILTLAALAIAVLETAGAPHVRISGSPSDPRYLTLTGTRYMASEIQGEIAPVAMLAPLEKHVWEYARDVWGLVRSRVGPRDGWSG